MEPNIFEEQLRELFDYQNFEGNPSLMRLIRETDLKYPKPLGDEELELVSAAGEPDVISPPQLPEVPDNE